MTGSVLRNLVLTSFSIVRHLYFHFIIKYGKQFIFCPADRLFINRENVCQDSMLFRFSLQYIFSSSLYIYRAQSAGSVEYADCTYAEVLDPTCAMDMTLNNLMMRFQWRWGFGECRAPLYCHCSQVHSDPTW